MNRVEQRKQRSMQALREIAKREYGIDPGPNLDSWPPELQELIEQSTKEPEKRMRRTMKSICKDLHLRWRDEYPTDHPYQAQLDGQIFKEETRFAVVELEAKNNKQVRGALLDLLTHPARNKILVLGTSAVCEPPKAVVHAHKVLGLLSPLVGQSRVAVFTEDELRQDPSILRRFLELP